MKRPIEELLEECLIKTSRSGGKGGQNVNKVSSKVELIFDIRLSALFSDHEKERLIQKLADKLDSDGLLHVVSQTSRSQQENKKTAAEKLNKLLENALKEKKARKATKPGKAAVEKRIAEKKKTGELKKMRNQKPPFE